MPGLRASNAKSRSRRPKRKALGAPRLAVVVQEALHGLEQDRKWQWSKGCQEATTEALRAFCKGYFDLKAEAARAGELTFIEGKIARLKREARGYEERGGGRRPTIKRPCLLVFLDCSRSRSSVVLTLFLAVLVEIGAALGLYFATGHLGGNDGGPIGPSRGVTVVEARVLKDISQPKTEAAPVKQIAGPASGPRRVPRMKRNQKS